MNAQNLWHQKYSDEMNQVSYKRGGHYGESYPFLFKVFRSPARVLGSLLYICWEHERHIPLVQFIVAGIFALWSLINDCTQLVNTGTVLNEHIWQYFLYVIAMNFYSNLFKRIEYGMVRSLVWSLYGTYTPTCIHTYIENFGLDEWFISYNTEVCAKLSFREATFYLLTEKKFEKK